MRSLSLPKSLGDLAPELEERRAQAGRIQERGELAVVAFEVGAEEGLDPADGAVALQFVEELVRQHPKPAAVAEEGLQRARQPTVAVGEVLAKELIQGRRGLRIGVLRLAKEARELGANGVDVDRHAGVHERRQADLQRSLDQGGPLQGRPLRDKRRQAGVREHQPFDDEAVALDDDPTEAAACRWRCGRRRDWRRRGLTRHPPERGGEADEVRRRFHGSDDAPPACQL